MNKLSRKWRKNRREGDDDQPIYDDTTDPIDTQEGICSARIVLHDISSLFNASPNFISLRIGKKFLSNETFERYHAYFMEEVNSWALIFTEESGSESNRQKVEKDVDSATETTNAEPSPLMDRLDTIAIICDANLQDLFGCESLSSEMVSQLLVPHFQFGSLCRCTLYMAQLWPPVVQQNERSYSFIYLFLSWMARC
ncbi:hypothetical protein GIB67_033878 [Kingdonia uniflora]|uniref:Uncharacterized protein n=1 Tax=Kingdonia uniflora TaxID=39325 RepID=A0A7J7MIW3_9MAGN|nr:hypothetical protein GIB67_033878 [Kingdonia uniflora]